VLYDVAEGRGLAVRKSVFFNGHIPSDGLLTAFPHLGMLGGESLDEVFDPAGHIHVALADTLSGPVESVPVPVVISADREPPLGIISGAVEAQDGEQPGGQAVVVQERVDASDYYCPNDFKAETGAVVEYHNAQQYHESLNDVMPAAVGISSSGAVETNQNPEDDTTEESLPKYLAETR
jgi:hypothetical protein